MTSVELFLQAGCPDQAADACAELAAAGGELSLRPVDELLRGLPETTPTSRRWLPWPIRAAVAAGRVDEARRLLDRADRTAASAEPGRPVGPDLAVARALVAEHLGDVDTLLTCADRLLEHLGRPRADPCSVARAHGWRVRALLWSGDTGRAKDALTSLDRATVEQAPEAAAELALADAWVAWFEGDISVTAESLAAAERVVGDDGAGFGELALLAGGARRERNQLAKAVPLLEEARSLATTFSHDVVGALAASELARCHRASGAIMKALELVVSTRAAHSDLPPAVDMQLRSTEARLRLDRGDVAGAQDILHGASPSADTQLLAARVALRRDPADARRLVDAIHARTSRQAVEKLLLHAQLPDGEPGDESTALTEAVSAGGSRGLVRTFLDEGPDVSRTLTLLAHESTDRTVGRLAALACQDLALEPARHQTGPTEQLTLRELAVLRLLPLRLSNREMAAQLYISVNTLKTHVRAIYRKLDVPHRSAAVRRATALQLV